MRDEGRSEIWWLPDARLAVNGPAEAILNLTAAALKHQHFQVHAGPGGRLEARQDGVLGSILPGGHRGRLLTLEVTVRAVAAESCVVYFDVKRAAVAPHRQFERTLDLVVTEYHRGGYTVTEEPDHSLRT